MRKPPGSAKRSLGFPEIPLPASPDAAPAVRIVTSEAAPEVGFTVTAPATTVLSSEAVADVAEPEQPVMPYCFDGRMRSARFRQQVLVHVADSAAVWWISPC
jgi:hypothetical protein